MFLEVVHSFISLSIRLWDPCILKPACKPSFPSDDDDDGRSVFPRLRQQVAVDDTEVQDINSSKAEEQLQSSNFRVNFKIKPLCCLILANIY